MIYVAWRGVLLLALVLGGCQSVPQQPVRTVPEPVPVSPSGEEVKAECSRRLADPAIDPIRSRMAVELDAKNSAKMLADPRKPTKAEKQAILAYALKREECAKDGFAWLRKSSTPMDIAFAEAQHAENRLLLADLYAGKLSYRQFAVKRQALLADSRARRSEFERLAGGKTPESQEGAQQIVDEYTRAAERDTRAALDRNRRNMEWMRLYKAVSE